MFRQHELLWRIIGCHYKRWKNAVIGMYGQLHLGCLFCVVGGRQILGSFPNLIYFWGTMGRSWRWPCVRRLWLLPLSYRLRTLYVWAAVILGRLWLALSVLTVMSLTANLKKKQTKGRGRKCSLHLGMPPCFDLVVTPESWQAISVASKHQHFSFLVF